MPDAVCPSCGGTSSAQNRFCGRCGADLTSTPGADFAATATSVPEQPTETTFDPVHADGRFAAGTMISDRYRIVGLLGRGGMGEVYRADDLKLGQPVALKFLPGHLERDPLKLSRFLNEVRTALKVSHPNVCRVHDINDVGGRQYISMEFVDGDDLGTLLRRIGRFPADKATEIARQLCAGLAAAHAGGILHRDLKPANIMIDGRGQAKITDWPASSGAKRFAPEPPRTWRRNNSPGKTSRSGATSMPWVSCCTRCTPAGRPTRAPLSTKSDAAAHPHRQAHRVTSTSWTLPSNA